MKKNIIISLHLYYLYQILNHKTFLNLILKKWSMVEILVLVYLIKLVSWNFSAGRI